MFDVEFSSIAKHFLKKADKQLAERIVQRIEKLSEEPFPSDVKRIVNRNEKIFRVRVGDYRIQYCVVYDETLIFISDIDKRERAY
ncbi:MAG: type II toxin-antitoxin system RelE/ParE family toxin [Candidatus Aenigmarchaeota archaeon]|nr:type II toxin-antitoxin system RelE/ParE family toxin [Candidatus Aenigmarchaeota archaeon]